jgi:hypothetical protein
MFIGTGGRVKVQRSAHFLAVAGQVGGKARQLFVGEGTLRNRSGHNPTTILSAGTERVDQKG